MKIGIAEIERALEHMSLDQLQRLVTSAQTALDKREADALVEGRVQGTPPCPHCGSEKVMRWGATRGGLQRWRCGSCTKTFTKATGTAVAHVRKRAAMAVVAQDMASPTPSACRPLARRLGVDKMTVWRWRLRMLEAVRGYGHDALAGLVEADETFFRESRKGSREWARHASDPQQYPAPPRPRWRDYDRHGLKLPRGLSRWQIPVLVLRDRHGATAAERLQALRYRYFETALDGSLADDAVLCSDGAAVYRRYGRTRSRRVEQVNTKAGIRVRDGVFHIQNANAFHARFQEFMRPFRGPATKNMALYTGWMVYRDARGARGPADDPRNPLMARVLAAR